MRMNSMLFTIRLGPSNHGTGGRHGFWNLLMSGRYLFLLKQNELSTWSLQSALQFFSFFLSFLSGAWFISWWMWVDALAVCQFVLVMGNLLLFHQHFLLPVNMTCLAMLQNARVQLEESLPGTGGGRNPNEELLVKFLFLLPLSILLFCYYRSFLQVRFCAYSFTFSKGVFFYIWISNVLMLMQTRAFCRSSLCDHVRQLYYQIRSNGALAYNGISSSSAINSTHQVGSLVPFCLKFNGRSWNDHMFA